MCVKINSINCYEYKCPHINNGNRASCNHRSINRRFFFIFNAINRQSSNIIIYTTFIELFTFKFESTTIWSRYLNGKQQQQQQEEEEEEKDEDA